MIPRCEGLCRCGTFLSIEAETLLEKIFIAEFAVPGIDVEGCKARRRDHHELANLLLAQEAVINLTTRPVDQRLLVVAQSMQIICHRIMARLVPRVTGRKQHAVRYRYEPGSCCPASSTPPSNDRRGTGQRRAKPDAKDIRARPYRRLASFHFPSWQLTYICRCNVIRNATPALDRVWRRALPDRCQPAR